MLHGTCHHRWQTAASFSLLQDVLRAAMIQAGIAPDTVGALRLHGTGTALGDPLEAGAALAALRSSQKPTLNATTANALAVSAVKSRIGHTEAAAGACGLLSSLHAIQHGLAPGQILPCAVQALCSMQRLVTHA